MATSQTKASETEAEERARLLAYMREAMGADVVDRNADRTTNAQLRRSVQRCEEQLAWYAGMGLIDDGA